MKHRKLVLPGKTGPKLDMAPKEMMYQIPWCEWQDVMMKRIEERKSGNLSSSLILR